MRKSLLASVCAAVALAGCGGAAGVEPNPNAAGDALREGNLRSVVPAAHSFGRRG